MLTENPNPTALIRALQDKLLNLGRDLADPDTNLAPAETERTAKAINQLIASVEKSETYLRTQGEGVRPGDYLRGNQRDAFLRKIKVLVDRGILAELDDE